MSSSFFSFLRCFFSRPLGYVYYESIKREPKIRGIYECRCDERLQTKTKKFTRFSYTTVTTLSCLLKFTDHPSVVPENNVRLSIRSSIDVVYVDRGKSSGEKRGDQGERRGCRYYCVVDTTVTKGCHTVLSYTLRYINLTDSDII